MSDLAPLIAIVGSDGSGKSTVAAAMVPVAQEFGACETAHLGLRSGDIGRAIANLPLIGRFADKQISSRASQARDKKARIPGLPTAIIIYLFSLMRVMRYNAMMQKRRAGIIILTDRYPQTDVPGFYDGPGLSAAAPDSKLVAWFAKRELAHYDRMAQHVPDLVIRLNVDLETAYARKPDHRYESLKQKVEATRKISYRGAPIVDLDSTDPLEKVLAEAADAVRACLSQARPPH